MEKIIDKKRINRITMLFWITYMASYITRINFGTVISEMEIATGISRSQLSMSVTGSFVTYGIGQVVSGVLGDKFSPKKLLGFGLLITVFMNIFMIFTSNPYVMLVLWCINGFAQSFMWPPIVKLMVGLFDMEQYKKSSAKTIYGSSFGTIALYFLSPLIIKVFGTWRAVFAFSAICGTVMYFLWQKFCPEIEVQKTEKVKSTGGVLKIFLAPVMIMIMLAIITQGMLRDGVTTWMPTYITDVYKLDNLISILSGIILPIFGLLSCQIASHLYRKKFTNPIMCAGIIFAVGLVSAVGIYLFSGENVILSLLFFALLTGAMHGVNLMLICMVPGCFAKTGKVSTVSGVINSCTYIGSALSTYGIAALSEGMGWNFTVMVWIGLAIFGTLLCFVSFKPWDKMING